MKRDADRKMVGLRLTAECRRLLVLLAEDKGISQSAVIELLVRAEARTLRIDADEIKTAA